MSSSHPDRLRRYNFGAELSAMTDGTSTVAELYQKADNGQQFVLGRGTARRHKGERHDPDMAARLAALRALEDAARNMRVLFEEAYPGALADAEAV